MANEPKSFEELLSEAPVATEAETRRLVGALSRAPEAGKFVLTLGDGRQVTLDVAAVKEHRQLGSAMGQTIVQVDLDAKRLPREVAAQATAGMTPGGAELFTIPWLDWKTPWRDTVPQFDPIKVPQFDTIPGQWPDIKIPYVDSIRKPPYVDSIYKSPYLDKDPGSDKIPYVDKPYVDKPPYLDKDPGSDKSPYVDKTPYRDKDPWIDVVGPGPVGPGGDPWGGFGVGAAATPFALATPHQAPMSTVAAMQGPAAAGAAATPFGGPFTWPVLDLGTGWRDRKNPWFDHKRPWMDGATGVAPYYD